MLWLALHLPRLALEVFPPQKCSVAVALQRVITMDAHAQSAGIQVGMRLAAALGLAPGLNVRERDSDAEVNALHGLACWAGNFTPHVHVAANDTLLLEIGGCVRLFGGLDVLHERVREECRALGWSLRSAVAPTPLAAHWLAFAQDGAVIHSMEEVLPALAPLPIEVMQLEPEAVRRLNAFGAKCLDDVFRLPQAGLSRRIGTQAVANLARATGKLADPRAAFDFPEHFSQGIQLIVPVSNTQALLFIGKRLVSALSGWLAARVGGISHCRIELMHERCPSTYVHLGFAELTRDAIRIERVLRERFERLQLLAPVDSISLHADVIQDLAGTTQSLFGEESGIGLIPVIERLRARLGEDKVGGLTVVQDHRPECATTAVARGLPATARPRDKRRPLWLLPEVRGLKEIDGQPFLEGPLRLMSNPERIDSGWWDAGEGSNDLVSVGDVSREYFVALTQRGECLWIFRDGKAWYWQGVFA